MKVTADGPLPLFHVCGRCPAEFPYPGKAFRTYDQLRFHMIQAHGKEPEEKPRPRAIDLRYLV